MAILIGTAASETIAGTAGDDRIEALAGNDELFGDTGNDNLDGGTGNDAIDGGAGNDQLIGGPGDDLIGGADGADTAYGGLGNDMIGGGAGNDRLFGEAGTDILHGEAGNDSLYGGSGDDTLLGGADNDNLYGGPGQDLVSGGSGADNLHGGDGPDRMSGGIGDNLYGEAGDDVLIWDTEQVVVGLSGKEPDSNISGGDGYDTLQVNTDALYYTMVYSDLYDKGFQPGPLVSDLNVYRDLYENGHTYIKLGYPTLEDPPGLFADVNGIERIEASGLGALHYENWPYPDDAHPLPDNFTVVGTVHDDNFRGGYGNEVLIGGAGNDTISGGIGTDRLEGGIGQDTVAGGADADQFIYAFDPNLPPTGGQKAYGLDGNDIIEDFNVGERDVVRLDATGDITPDQAKGISSDETEILVTQTAEKALLTFGGNGATLQFDTLGINDIGAISGDTLNALESKIISLTGASTYDPFLII
jgi:Ca2+-binding RTX toxin-like protein